MAFFTLHPAREFQDQRNAFGPTNSFLGRNSMISYPQIQYIPSAPNLPIPILPIPILRAQILHPPVLYVHEHPGFMTIPSTNRLPIVNLGIPRRENRGPREHEGSVRALPCGLVSLFAEEDIRVDLTIDGAIRAHSVKNGVSLAISAKGDTAGMVHPLGRVYQRNDGRIFVTTWDSKYGTRYARIFESGISFKSEERNTIYKITSSGTQTTSDDFYELNSDFTKAVLNRESCVGGRYFGSCRDIVNSVLCNESIEGVREWIINGIKIIKRADGVIKIFRDDDTVQLGIRPDGKARLFTPHVYCTASNGNNKHLFVCKDDKRLHFDGKKFSVKCGSSSAGFCGSNRLSIS